MALIFLSLFYYLQVYLKEAPEPVFWLLSLLSPSAVAMGIDKVRLTPGRC